MDDYKRSIQAYKGYIDCRSLYVASANSFDTELQMNQQRASTEMLVLQFLFTCLPQKKFNFPMFRNIIIDSSSRDDFEFSKLSEAFVNLENYIILICIMPWKQEFHQIKKYGGYYQTKIESHLRNAESVLQLIGFKEVNGLLSLTEAVNTELLQTVAFHCFLSSVEVKIMGNIWKRTKDVGASIRDVVSVRSENRGSEDKIVEIILTKYRKSAVDSGNVADSANFNHEKPRPQRPGSNDQFRDKLQSHLQMAKKIGGDIEDIPFIDETVIKDSDHTPVNMDEQMIASLKLINKGQVDSEQPTQVISGLKPSQEWSFVREGLERSYGKQYFEGVRKDILSNDSGLEAARSDNKGVKVLSNHQYVSADITAANSPLVITNPSIGRDSDYATASTALFPPTVDDSHLMRTRGLPSMHTDTVLTKGRTADIKYQQSSHSKTEPIARRVSGQQLPGAHETYPPHSSIDNSTPDIRAMMDYNNIKKYQQKSIPSVHPGLNRSGSLQSNPNQYTPVVQNSSSLSNRLGSQSYSENIKRNTNMADGANSLKRASRPVHSAPLQGVTSLPTWACRHCTFINHANAVICEMCSKTSDGMEVDAPAGQTSRICEQCTLENDRNAVNCHACGHHLKGAQTCV